MAKAETGEMFKPDYDGERPKTTLSGPEGELRRAWLLAGNLLYLDALEANGFTRCADALLEKISHGMSRPVRPRDPEPTDRVTLPDEERGRSARDLERLDQINARLLRGYQPKRGEGGTVEEQREKDLKAREALEHEIIHRADQKLDALRAQETERLAEARGEEIGSERGMKRILDRDPLLSLARAGHLTPDQLETGQEVRDLYDRRGEDASAMEYTGMPGGGHNHEHFVGKRFERAKACEMIGRMERKVAELCTNEPACLTMIRVVCERGMSVTSQGKGRAFERNAAALARGLDVADDVLRRRV